MPKSSLKLTLQPKRAGYLDWPDLTPQQELDIARTIVGEAEGESFQGQLAVAEVIRNRARLRHRSPYEIVHARKQFSSWNTPQSRKRFAQLGFGDPSVANALAAWKMVNEPLHEDVVPGATHFYNPELAKPYWVPKMRQVGQVGRHAFLSDPTIWKPAPIIKEQQKAVGPVRFQLVKPAAREVAPGLPSREEYGDIENLKQLVGQLTPWVVQEHLSRRPHYDLRLRGPEGLYSWALPKPRLPEPGEKALAVSQPIHEPSYLGFRGEIPPGVYGAGTVRPAFGGHVMITRFHPKEIRFTYSTGAQPVERFILKHMGKDKQWLLLNVTPTEPLGVEKPHFDVVDEQTMRELLKQVSPDAPVSAKLDGALAIVKFLKDRAEIMSYRTSKRRAGFPITHTERVAPELMSGLQVPPELVGKTLLGEVIGLQKGRAIPPEVLGGLLNAALAKSREKQQAGDIAMQVALFGALDEMPEEEKRKLLETARGVAPGVFTAPPMATTPQEAEQLAGAVFGGEHPLTREGLVFTRPGRAPAKYKLLGVPETEVVVTGFTEGTGRLAGKGVGAINYALTPGGGTVGKVGTGLPDELRKELFEYPEEYIGRVIKVKAQAIYPAGAMRAPRFVDFTDYPIHGPGDQIDWGTVIQNRMAENKQAAVYNPPHRLHLGPFVL